MRGRKGCSGANSTAAILGEGRRYRLHVWCAVRGRPLPLFNFASNGMDSSLYTAICFAANPTPQPSAGTSRTQHGRGVSEVSTVGIAYCQAV